MLILDQLKKADGQLQTIALGALVGLLLLLGGVWRVQVMHGKQYQQRQDNQSYRTVRLSAIRGKILDRSGAPLAENRPSYGVYLYLEELRERFKAKYRAERLAILHARSQNSKPEEWWREWLVRLKLVKPSSNRTGLTKEEVEKLGRRCRYEVVSNLTFEVSAYLASPQVLSEAAFQRHYSEQLALPLPIVDNLSSKQMARFSERAQGFPGVEMEFQPLRYYPHGTLAAHLLGYLRRERMDGVEEDLSYDYQLPDFKGRSGLEASFDNELRGKPGVKSMLVNNLGYRQLEDIWINPEPGMNVVLTLDLGIQKAVESAIRLEGAERGAAVVLDVQSGDVLALASFPSFDPNRFMGPIPQKEWDEKFNDPDLTPLFNRATYGAYPPGSIFKIVTALACLESGLDPHEQIQNPGYFQFPNRRSRPIDDTAPAGSYDFMRAFKLSSNTYFIVNGLKARADKIVEMGQRFGLGLKTGVPVFGEAAGDFPTLGETRATGFEHNTAMLSIGQGPITVTPLQMAVMTSAIANDGKVWRPRIVARLESQSSGDTKVLKEFPQRQLFGNLGVREENLRWLRQAMRADVQDHIEGTGKRADVNGMEVCGKTGTAEVKANGYLVKKVTWFVSFAPLSSPRYAVVVMVDYGGSGGKTCAPIAGRIYETLQRLERRGQLPTSSQSISGTETSPLPHALVHSKQNRSIGIVE